MLYKIFYTDRVLPDRFGGMTVGCIVFIRPKYREDIGILKHEETHVRQFWRLPALNGLLYVLSKKWRLKAEVEAYREQLCWPPAISDYVRYKQAYAGFISTKYYLDVTEAETLKLLS